MNNLKRQRSPSVKKCVLGFTLLEILIALFIFSIISVILAGALRSAINAYEGTAESALRLRTLQMTLLLLSRDVDQIVNRPIFNAANHEEAAFIGTPRHFAFTHGGFANVSASVTRSTLERTAYLWNENALWRLTWDVLDQAPTSTPHSRKMISDVSLARFQYLDKEGRPHNNWPLEEDANQVLPRAISVQFTFSKWGKLSQLYVIPIQANKIE